MKRLNLAIATVATLVLVGCGGGSSTSTTDDNPSDSVVSYDGSKASDPTKIQKVEYRIENNTVICNKPGAIVEVNNSGVEVMQCVWYCGDYEGASPIAVYLGFTKSAGSWEFTSESTVDGGTSCHN